MGTFTKSDMEQAPAVIASMINRAEKAQSKFAEGSSQHTLQKNRIAALRIARALIEQELAGPDAATMYAKEDLENAVAPLSSLISKSEKAQQKLKEGTWQHKMLESNLKALHIVAPLLSGAIIRI